MQKILVYINIKLKAIEFIKQISKHIKRRDLKLRLMLVLEIGIYMMLIIGKKDIILAVNF